MVSDLEDISSFDEKYVTKIDGIISRHNCQVEKTPFRSNRWSAKTYHFIYFIINSRINSFRQVFVYSGL
jgi:hypothetical protein